MYAPASSNKTYCTLIHC